MGSGGLETSKLLERLVFTKVPQRLKTVEKGLGIDFPDDSAAIPLKDGGYLVVTVDSYTVSPVFFPGGDLGMLAAAGTINDVLMLGGKPVAALDSLVVEEGLEYSVVQRVFESMVDVFMTEDVKLVGGDFKVMPKGQLDQIIISATGLGFAEKIIADKNIAAGDKIIVSGWLGEHGAAVLAAQHRFDSSEFTSDVKPLTKLMMPVIEEFVEYIDAARDPTRGGLSMVLHDWARSSNLSIFVDEVEIPVREPVSNLCEMMGIDPLSLASEGVAVLAVKPHAAEQILETMHSAGFRDARIIGEVRENIRSTSFVVMKTVIGGYRVLEPPTGEIVPRIC
ncbi:MAG: hydrogenase expression/formation protein HypE, partial [Candidatus Caldarchaeum sp.]|nr:hydrogenase expression/formation protein HypE [Candidatus Caldarchaeum sp.]